MNSLKKYARDQRKKNEFISKWKLDNSHNETIPGNIFPEDLAEVGRYTYGTLNIRFWNTPGEGLKIGNYVSIADDVIFVLGGNHNYKGFMTFPFRVKFMDTQSEAYSNGPIIVEDDVWIGMNSIILSGVTIGKGSVVAAGSVIVKNVPPYSIVGGNPARIIKNRFEPALVEELIKMDISNIDKVKFTKIIELLYKDLDQPTLSEIRRNIYTEDED